LEKSLQRLTAGYQDITLSREEPFPHLGEKIIRGERTHKKSGSDSSGVMSLCIFWERGRLLEMEKSQKRRACQKVRLMRKGGWGDGGRSSFDRPFHIN